jgi:hypothetical protein
MSFWHVVFGISGGGTAAVSHTITMEFETGLTSGPQADEVDGTRKVIATLTPGDASVVYVFDETELG